jgi:hypothetical protein
MVAARVVAEARTEEVPAPAAELRAWELAAVEGVAAVVVGEPMGRVGSDLAEWRRAAW